MNSRWAAAPYLIWMIIFIVVPLILVVYYSLSVENDMGMVISLKNFQRFLNLFI